LCICETNIMVLTLYIVLIVLALTLF